MKTDNTVYVVAINEDGSIPRKTKTETKRLLSVACEEEDFQKVPVPIYVSTDQNTYAVGLRTGKSMNGLQMRRRAREISKQISGLNPEQIIILRDTFLFKEAAILQEMVRGLLENYVVSKSSLPTVNTITFENNRELLCPADRQEISWLYDVTDNGVSARIESLRSFANVSVNKLGEDELHALGFGSVHKVFAKDPELLELTYTPDVSNEQPIVLTASVENSTELASMVLLVFEFLAAHEFAYPLTAVFFMGTGRVDTESESYRLITEEVIERATNLNKYYHLTVEAVFYSLTAAPKSILSVLRAEDGLFSAAYGDYRPVVYSKAQFGKEIPFDLNEPVLPFIIESEAFFSNSLDEIHRVAQLAEKHRTYWLHMFTKTTGHSNGRSTVDEIWFDDYYALLANIYRMTSRT